MPCQPALDVTDEVSEYKGALLVRMGRGSAMQMRIQQDQGSVWFRIVPISNATQLEDDSPWHAASDSQLRAWIHPESAIGRWLLAKGVVVTKGVDLAKQLDDRALPLTSRSRRPSLPAPRSKSLMSLR
jgi:hypothetical protein